MFQRFLLEYDDEPSGGFEPLRQVPADRSVVLGLVSSKKPKLESKDELKKRIDATSQFVALERLALSPQCGFASTMEGNAVTAADQEAKRAWWPKRRGKSGAGPSRRRRVEFEQRSGRTGLVAASREDNAGGLSGAPLEIVCNCLTSSSRCFCSDSSGFSFMAMSTRRDR
jgi:hypothetical protein